MGALSREPVDRGSGPGPLLAGEVQPASANGGSWRGRPSHPEGAGGVGVSGRSRHQERSGVYGARNFCGRAETRDPLVHWGRAPLCGCKRPGPHPAPRCPDGRAAPPTDEINQPSRRARIGAGGCQSARRSAPAFHQANMCTVAAPARTGAPQLPSGGASRLKRPKSRLVPSSRPAAGRARTTAVGRPSPLSRLTPTPLCRPPSGSWRRAGRLAAEGGAVPRLVALGRRVASSTAW